MQPAGNLTETERVLEAMLREPTGGCYLDSGALYGYQWQRNRMTDLAAQEPVQLRWDQGYLSVTLSVYHFLRHCLEYDPVLDQCFRWWAAAPERRQAPWPSLMEAFPGFLARQGREVAGPWGSPEPWLINTYNHPDLLSQVLQYLYFTLDGEEYVLLQVHNGCDVRGGYTAPRAFRVHSDGPVSLLHHAAATVYCERPEGISDHCWRTDDAYHWHYQGEDCPLAVCLGTVPVSRELAWQLDLTSFPVCLREDWEAQFPQASPLGVVIVEADGQGRCPLCGEGLLRAAY